MGSIESALGCIIPMSGLHRREAIPALKEASTSNLVCGVVVCLAGPTKDEETSSMRRSASEQEPTPEYLASIEMNKRKFLIRWSRYEAR